MRRLTELFDLTGRRALVTGGAGHIGRAACEALLEQGARVAVLDRDAAACERRARELGRSAWALPCDLSREASARGAARKAVRRMGGLDIVVHAAGFVGTTRLRGWSEPFERQSVAAWDAALRVNLTSAFALAQEAAPALRASKRGSVILVSSIYGFCAPDFSLYAGTKMVNPAAYGASKAGLLQLARHLASVLAPEARVNAVSPGGVLRAGQAPAFRRRYAARVPLRRLALEEDLKGAVAYLASDASAYVTGQNLVVDGGWSAW